MSGAFDGGRVLAGRYRLRDQLGRGGMGVVWRAWDEILGREVAVKEVRAPAGLPEGEVRLLYARLEREARAAARISHRNVVTVHDVVSEDGRPWIVMELVRGMSFADLLEAEGPVGPVRAAHVGVEVLAALRAAHAVGVLHRDVKPANVLMASNGRVVLTDFGIAVVEGNAALTVTGQLVGSPEFLAPERVLGRPPGPESDLWSLGVTLYAAVEGHSPFRQDTPLSTLRAVVDQELPPPSRAGALAPVIAGLLRKDPARRMSADEAERMLHTVAAGGTPHPAAAYTPTVSAPPPGETAVPAARAAPPPPGPGGTGTTGEQGRNRRPLAFVVTAAVLALLAIAALAWALADRAGSGGGSSAHGGGSSTGEDRGAPPPARPSAGHTTKGGGNPAPPPSASPSPSGYAVRAEVTPERDHYSGPCPVPDDRAPSFTAAITVDRTPAKVVYRWISGSGKVADGGWRTVSLGESGAVSVRYTETGRGAGDPGHDWMAVEVRSPGKVTSNHVRFTITCRSASTAAPSAPSSSY
ncbi:serine/threonine-protein kinase [Streptomyces orinoci]|uniref:non-specific serine/threonine protein kinase n=1 Tax=Streptomyces orinoci TaxID=67339 RepID=A0ABV3K4E0_STRON|nr:serine/threonine-protein kinase [Streptomyces orinoci]